MDPAQEETETSARTGSWFRKSAADRPPRSAGTRLLLSRLPITILVIAYVVVFLVRQLPELAGVRALTQVSRQASVLVWASLPGTGGAGAAGSASVPVVLAIIGAIVLALLGTKPAADWRFIPEGVRGWFGWLAVPAAALVVIGIVMRVLTVLGQTSWSPVPYGGAAFGLLAAVAAFFAIREIVLASPSGSGSGGPDDGGAWRGKGWFIAIAVTWFGDVAIGRYFEPQLIAKVAAAAPSKRWDYLFQGPSWWLYLVGVLVVLGVYALVQLLPPWDGGARKLVIAVVCVIVAFVAIQQVLPYAHTAAAHIIAHGAKH
ncbi:MAG: hypothetical protein FWE35_00225 [Streptosporangiales bacterium]|nr:hypothetical protein [Streptosporangiales bacterium]